MTFEEVLSQTIQILQRQGRVSYRALKRQFGLDDAYLKDLTFELVEVLKVAADQDQVILVWTGQLSGSTEYDSSTTRPESERASSDSLIVPNASSVAASAYGAERRQLTVMFCDLVDSTQLAEVLDPEDLREVFLVYQKVCAKAIASAEGYIAQYLGDGVLIYFGYPQAHEDDARRAVSSGLRILEAIKRLNPQIEKEWGVSLAIRIGIHTGLVIVGEMGVREAPSPMAVVGETPNIAARLQSIAAPNTLLLSAATHRLITGFFEFHMLGRCPLKGISEPILVYQALHESTARNRFEVAEKSGLTPFVNRREEREFLLRHWQEARAGRSHAVLLQGEAGMGKSRMVWELKKCISQESDAWLTELQGSPYYRSSAYYPIIELLQKFTFRFGRDDTPAEKIAKIESFLIQYTLDLEQYVPLFASLLSVSFESKYDTLNLTPERQKQKTVEALGNIFLLISAQHPVLLVIEDLHWMDASTLDVIAYVLNQATDSHLLTLLTFRPEFTPPWSRLPHVLSLDLKHLPIQETKLIIEQTAHGKFLPQEVLRQIIQKTDGVPLFVEELTKTVLESNWLQETETSYELTGSSPMLSIPTTLHDSLIARLDRLEIVKDIAQFCATLGREFDYGLIVTLSPWDGTTLRNGLNQLVEAGLLYQHGTFPEVTYQFKHALIQDAAYQSLLKGRRQQYHRQIAGALEGQSLRATATQPEVLAHHFTEAGLFEKALYYWQKAGQRDLEQAANLEAIAHFTRGLEVLQRLPAGAKRDQQELLMQLGLAPAYMAIKGWGAQEVEQASLRARDLSQALGDNQSLSAALWGLWTNYFLRGQMNSALDTATAVFQMAGYANQPLLSLIACHAVGYTHHFRGEFSSARTYAEQGLTYFNLETERQIVRSFQLSSTVCIRMFLGSSLWMLGYSEQSSRHVTDALALAEELQNTPNKAYALAASCFYHHYLRNIEWILNKTRTLIEISQEESFLLWLPVAMIFHGWALSMRGSTADGIAEMQEGLELFLKTGTTVIMPHVMVMLAEVYFKVGQLEKALTALEAGIYESASRNERHMEPELYRLKAEILLQQALTQKNVDLTVIEQAETCFQRSLDLAQQQGALMLELRSATGLSRLWQRQGRQQDAYSLLFEIYSRFTEGWNMPDLRAARLLLDHLALDR